MHDYMTDIPRIFRTVIHLKAPQIYHFIRNRFLPIQTNINFGDVIDLEINDEFSLGRTVYGAANMYDGDRSFLFLNKQVNYKDGILWNDPDQSKLWLYNLHYFDYLGLPKVCSQKKAELIDDWIQNNDIADQGNGWEPYTASLRIVNWIKFFSHADVDVKSHWKASLFLQTQWLIENLEFHIRANHLLKNYVAVLFAGIFFKGEEAKKWRAIGCKGVISQINEQFLADGGHYECSPMYHAIAIADLLDLLNLLSNNNSDISTLFSDKINDVIDKGLHFLSDLTHPDEGLALFNDSAFGVAPPLRYLEAYYRQNSNVIGLPYKPKNGLISYIDTGYYGVKWDNDYLIVDGGNIASPHQPGHTHNDTFSFELSIGGNRVITDTGVKSYDEGEARFNARKTSSHNTAQLNDYEHSEIWGAFRVGRRAHARVHYAQLESDSTFCFIAKHNGYRYLAGKPTHQRQIRFMRNGYLEIMDSFFGTSKYNMSSYLHFAPDHKVVIQSDYALVFDSNNRAVLGIKATDGCQMSVKQSPYYPEFGKEEERITLCLTRRSSLPAQLGWQLFKYDHPKFIYLFEMEESKMVMAQ